VSTRTGLTTVAGAGRRGGRVRAGRSAADAVGGDEGDYLTPEGSERVGWLPQSWQRPCKKMMLPASQLVGAVMSGQNTAIRYTLERIRASVRQQSLAQTPASKGKRIGDPEHHAFWGKLALYETDLRRILRQLLGRQVALENERSLLWRIPRELRYSARQSVDDREIVNLDLVELAQITLSELLEFSGDASTMKAGDWETLGEKVIEFAERVDQALVHTVVRQMQKGPAFTSTALPGLELAHLAPLVGLLIAYIMSKRRKPD
jgi:hypothetical protein